MKTSLEQQGTELNKQNIEQTQELSACRQQLADCKSELQTMKDNFETQLSKQRDDIAMAELAHTEKLAFEQSEHKAEIESANKERQNKLDEVKTEADQRVKVLKVMQTTIIIS